MEQSSATVSAPDRPKKRGPPLRPVGAPPAKRATVSDVDRARIVDAARRGGDLKKIAQALGINLKTARSVAATDRETPKKKGGSTPKFGSDVVAVVKDIVDRNPTYTLNQIQEAVQEALTGLRISTSSIDRLLDAHNYTIKMVTPQPMDRNRTDVKENRKKYAQWLRTDGKQVRRYYLDETNYNIWCCRNFGRARKGAPAVHTTTASKGANLNIMACMSDRGVLHWNTADKVHWVVFNDFLSEVSTHVQNTEPDREAVFVFDNAPAHSRAEQATLASSRHSLKRLPPYSPFFNPIEEVFSKFKLGVKSLLSEQRDAMLSTPHGQTKQQHRRSLLRCAAERSMARIQPADCEAYDRHSFTFIRAALRKENM